jgi:hypothetical protein
MSDMDAQISWLVSLITDCPQTEVTDSSLEKTADGAEIGHIFYNDIQPRGVDSYHIVIHHTLKPSTELGEEISEAHAEDLPAVSTSSQHSS